MNKLKISAILFFLTITILSLLPPKSGIEMPTNDKIGHALAYAVLTLNSLLLFKKFNRNAIIMISCILGYGILIEFIQGFIGRESSFNDFLANTIGVVVSLICFIFFGKQIKHFLVKINVISSNEE